MRSAPKTSSKHQFAPIISLSYLLNKYACIWSLQQIGRLQVCCKLLNNAKSTEITRNQSLDTTDRGWRVSTGNISACKLLIITGDECIYRKIWRNRATKSLQSPNHKKGLRDYPESHKSLQLSKDAWACV